MLKFLGKEDHGQFQRAGYLLIDPEVPGAVLDGVVKDMDGLYTSGEPLNVAYRDARRIQDAWRISSNVRALATAPKVLAILRELYGRQPLPFQTLNFPFGTEQRPHSDTIHFNSIPAGYMCGVWVALEDIDMNNGPLVYYPGSHKLPVYDLADIGIAAGPPHYRYYEDFIGNLIAQRKLQPHFATVKKGQALIWASNLLHGGSTHQDRNRSRHSQVTHYYFSGCRYFTPLCSEKDNVFWRNPEWIEPGHRIRKPGLLRKLARIGWVSLAGR